MRSNNSLQFWDMKNRLIMLCATIALTGCAEDVAATRGEGPATARWSQIVVQQDLRDVHPTWHAEAWFAEYTGFSEQALKNAMDVWEPPTSDGCELRKLPNDEEQDSRVRFRAVGAAQLTDDAQRPYRITPHALTLHNDAIDGVVYASSTGLGDTSWWRVDVQEAHEIVRYEVQEAAPRGWGIVQVNGQEVFDTTVTLSAQDDLTIGINSDAQHTFVIVRAPDSRMHQELVCSVQDGTVTIPGSLRQQLGTDNQDLDVIVVLRNSQPLPRAADEPGRFDIELRDGLQLRTR